MESDLLSIFTATAKPDIKDTSLYNSLLDFGYDVDLTSVVNNTEKLSKVYNKALDDARENGAGHLIICHDDVHLEGDPIPKLRELFKRFDIVGVAGTSKLEMKSPALWHLMGGGFEGGNLRGAVAHGNRRMKYMTAFGYYPSRVVAIDGVFMAFNRNAIENVRFDEDCPSKFHFYDLCMCARAMEKGLKIGVGDITVTHESPGLREFTEDWKVGEKYYLETYGN